MLLLLDANFPAQREPPQGDLPCAGALDEDDFGSLHSSCLGYLNSGLAIGVAQESGVEQY